MFCGEAQNLKVLYPQNFKDKDVKASLFSARRATEHFHYDIVLCKNCGLVFSWKIFSEDELSKLYMESEVKYTSIIDNISKDYMRHLKPFFNYLNKETALEIGCGNGFFLEGLLKEGFKNVYGCEPSIQAKESSNVTIKENITSSLFVKDIYQPNTFDLICSFQTIDHLSNPTETIQICKDILKPNGAVYFIMHDVCSFQSKILRESSPIIDIEHVYLFNKKTIKKLLKENGFEVIKVGNIKNTYPLKYWSNIMSNNFIFRMINSVLEKTFLGNISFPISAGNMFVFARKK